MKRGAIVGTVVGVLLIGGVAAAVAITSTGGAADAVPTPSGTSSTAAPPPPSESASPTPTAEPAPTASAGAYVDYSDEALAAAEGTRILFFHAPWCPQCRALEADILAAGVPDGYTILKVDYDSRQDLRQQYDVRLQTTLVALDDAGAGSALFVAYDEPTLAASLTGLGLAG